MGVVMILSYTCIHTHLRFIHHFFSYKKRDGKQNNFVHFTHSLRVSWTNGACLEPSDRFFLDGKDTILFGVGRVLSYYVEIIEFGPQHHINWKRWYSPAVLALGKWRPEDQKLKVILSYKASQWQLGYMRCLKTQKQKHQNAQQFF